MFVEKCEHVKCIKGTLLYHTPFGKFLLFVPKHPKKKSEKKDAFVPLFPGVGNNGTPVGKNGTHSIFGGKFRENA